jgi:segregation and condensation protein B
MDQEKLDNAVLALLFASEDALSARRIAGVLDDGVSTDDVNASVNRLTEFLIEKIPSIRLERVAGGFQLATNSDFAEYIALLYSGRRKQRLSKAGMEALAIIAYKQPITRADIENVRGVGCGGVITTLLERSLIRIVGKAKVLGAPFLYGTTPEFLEYLGLNSLKDLPSMEQLEELLEKEESSGSDDEDMQGGSASAEDTSISPERDEFDLPSDADTGEGEVRGAAAVEPFTMPGDDHDVPADMEQHEGDDERRDYEQSEESDEPEEDEWETSPQPETAAEPEADPASVRIDDKE